MMKKMSAAKNAKQQWHEAGRQDWLTVGSFSDHAKLVEGLPEVVVAVLREWWDEGYDEAAHEDSGPCPVTNYCARHDKVHRHDCSIEGDGSPHPAECQVCERAARDEYLAGMA